MAAGTLELARADLASAARALRREGPGTRWVAHGLALVEGGPEGTVWRSGPLVVAPLDGPPVAPLACPPRREAAIVLLQFASAEAQQPLGTNVWERWLMTHAPAWRLLLPDRDPTLLAAWMNEAGQVSAAMRQGRHWLPLDGLALPGRGMLRIPLGPVSVVPPDPLEGLHGRYSRQSGALGLDTLRRLQGAVFAVVGLGRTGSVLAHTLARAGAGLMLIDPDRVELHNLDGDVLPQHEGLPKVDAVARWLRPLARPGAAIDPRWLDIGDRVCGTLLARADAVLSCVDDDRARLWAAAWSAALLKPHLDVGTAVRAGELGADIRLTVPGGGCLACVGGFAEPDRLPVDARGDLRDAPADFRTQRAGSLRSWGSAAAHLGLRLVETLYAGTLQGSVFRRLQEDAFGRLSAQDRPATAAPGCPLCARLQGVGAQGVDAGVVYGIARRIRTRTENPAPMARRA